MHEYAGHGHGIRIRIRNKHGTLLQELSAIRYFNTGLWYANSLENCPSPDRIMKGIMRECGAVARNSKLPVTSGHGMLRRIVERADFTQLRTRAVVTSMVTAFVFLLRCSEYASQARASVGKHVIKRFHVVLKRNGIVTTNPMIADQVEIAIPSSKTDQQGQGHTRTHYKNDSLLCSVRLTANSRVHRTGNSKKLTLLKTDQSGRSIEHGIRGHRTAL